MKRISLILLLFSCNFLVSQRIALVGGTLIDGNGNASADVTSDGAAQLGEAINMSVMETLIKEQRPGGLLNP